MSPWALTAPASVWRATLSFGALTCVSKLALALSAVATGSLLTGVDYRAMRAAQDWILPTMTSATGLGSLAALATILALAKPAKSVRPARSGSIGLGA